MEGYVKFNMEQILPILIELNLAKDATSETIVILQNYMEDLNNILKSEVLYENIMDKIKKNHEFISCQIKNAIYRQNPLKKIGGKKESVYEKMNRGFIYRYKINNNVIAENPELLNIDSILFSDDYHEIIINKEKIKIYYEYKNTTHENLSNNIIDIKIIIELMKIILLKINNYIRMIREDVIHFNLFDEKYLEI
jgi:hypothetical protein